MTLNEIASLDEKYYMNTFGKRLPVAFERGEGTKLYAADGRVFNDFLGGIAVNALGHSHPKFVAALKAQAEKLLHTSSLYYIENQARLAQELVERTCADRAFFCSTGAEANEGALKLAKIYFYKRGLDKYEVISLDNSFHGRTLATVAATGQEKYQKPYRPNVPGFSQVEPNTFAALEARVTDKTAAIILEPIQGEGGVHPLDIEYLKKVRQLCDERDIVLIFDEVQTGMGRCGELFCYMTTGVEPDIFTAAKALGGGVPIGALLAKEKFADAFAPGDHGTTFGGNPFATAAGLAVLKIFDEEKLVENSRSMGEYFKKALGGISSDKIAEIRGRGLLIGIELADGYGKKAFDALFEKGYLTSLCGGKTLRLAPPLIINKEEIDGFVGALDEVLREL